MSESEEGRGVAVVVGQECREDGAACAGASGASDTNVAAMTGDDVVGDPKAKAVAYVLLGGEEEVEDPGEEFLRDAGPCVGHTDNGPRTLAIVP